MPVYKHNILVPVESAYERWVLDLTVKTIKTNYDGFNFIIEKPLFCLSTSDKQKYRPDFIVEYVPTRKTIYIEVLGQQDEEYLSHKVMICGEAERYCDYYISIKAYKWHVEKLTFVKTLICKLDLLSRN